MESGKKKYYGEHHIIIDGKGRLPLPALIKTEVEENGHYNWWITHGFDKQLLLFQDEHWQQILQKEIPPPSMDPRIMDFRRRFVGGAHKVAVDAQLRLLIPAPQRQYAEISRESVLLGLEDRMELWGSNRWKQFRDNQVSDYRVMAMDLFGQHRNNAGQEQEDEEHVRM